jgi:hypothetical protein
MITKVCYVCGIEKEIGDFYAQKKNTDGYLNKCKECQKSVSDERYKRLFADQEWREKERLRSLEKYRRLNYRQRLYELDKNKPYKNKIKHLHHRERLGKGQNIHHWNYNFGEDFFILETMFHRFIHRYLRLDPATLIFRTKEGRLLDTRESHEQYINGLRTIYLPI